QFADILVEMAGEIEKITEMIWNLANERKIHEGIVRISDLENRADVLHNTVIADLFKSIGRDPLEILKWKEVYEGLENACDQCKDYSHVVGNVVVKNACNRLQVYPNGPPRPHRPGRPHLRLPQRLSRRGELDRHRGLDAGAVAA